MIFCSRNERGVVKANWIASLPVGAVFVTRREKPKVVGVVVAVCPGRGKKEVARAVVLTCGTHISWIYNSLLKTKEDHKKILEQEARLEGFKSVEGWLSWYPAHKIDISKTFRIVMEKIS